MDSSTLTLERKRPGKELLSYALPAIVSMVLSAAIVIVDGLFIGRSEGSAGLAAVNLTLPVFYLFLGTTIMIGTGGSVMISHKRGAGEMNEAHRLFSGTLAVLTMTIAILSVLLVVFFEPVLSLLTRTEELSGPLRSYLGVLRWFYPIMMLNLCICILIRTEGRPALSMVFGLVGNILNGILNYLFIVKMGMGIHGAALATGLASILPFMFSLAYFLSGKSIFRLTEPRLEKAVVGGIIYNGSSELVTQLSAAFSAWLFNTVVLRHMGVDGLAAYTIAGYLIFIQGMIVIGLATGMGPLVSYHWGGGRRTHLQNILRIALISAAAAGALAWLAVILGGSSVAAGISGGNENVRRLSARGFWIFTSAFLFNGFNILVSTFFTSLGDAGISALISSLRGLVFNCLFVFLFPIIWGSESIWLSLPAAELATLFFAAAFLYRRILGFSERQEEGYSGDLHHHYRGSSA